MARDKFSYSGSSIGDIFCRKHVLKVIM